MEALIRDYAVLLTGSGAASDKFWALEKRIREDQQHVGVVARMSRSNMYKPSGSAPGWSDHAG